MKNDRLHREGVLMFLLDEPGLVTIEEAVAHMLAYIDPEHHAEFRDGVDRAIRDLVGAGVLNRVGRSVYASRATREVAYLIEGNTTGRAA